jgi:outer membrane protein OmpA-like peptidoglycan-associated protein
MKKIRIMISKLIGLTTLMLLSLFVVGQSPSSSFIETNEFQIGSVGFNTMASEFGPSFVENELYFSAYTDKHIKKLMQAKFDNTYYSLFKTSVNEKGLTASEPRVLIRDFDSGFHEGPVSYCDKTGELFITLSNTVNVEVEVDGIVVKKQVVRLRLVVCKKNNGKWIQKEEMPFNDPVYSVGQPSVSSTGDTLFFTSDNPAISLGGTDIFIVIRKDGVWGAPVGLGGKINTTGNEMFPFFHPSGMLLFASNKGADPKGGLDLYAADILNNNAVEVRPLDMFNTNYDDFGLVIHPSDEVGYFTSNRPGQKGDDDIYMVKIKNTYIVKTGVVVDVITEKPIGGAKVTLYNCEGGKEDSCRADINGHFSFKVLKNRCLKAGASYVNYSDEINPESNTNVFEIRLKPKRSLKLEVLDYDNRLPVQDAGVQVNDISLGKTSGEGVISKELTSEKELNLKIFAKGYLNQSLKVNVPEIGNLNQTVLLMKMEMNKTFVLDNIYYDLDSWKILPSSENELSKLIKIMNENPSIKIELGSHTDSRGSDQYNLNLSQKRSESSVAYIVKNGILKDRITAKGYGETHLLNRCKNGATCSDDEHRKNRRTEFKIIGFTK